MNPILIAIGIIFYFVIAGIIAGVLTYKNERKDREAVEDNVVIGLFWFVYVIFSPILLTRNILVKMAIVIAEKLKEFDSKKK